MHLPASDGIACDDSDRFFSHNIPDMPSIVSPLHVVLPLQSGDLGAITDGAQIGTFGAHEVKPLEALIGLCGAKQCTPTTRACPLPYDPAVWLARCARSPREHGGHPDHEQKPHQGTAPGIAHQS